MVNLPSRPAGFLLLGGAGIMGISTLIQTIMFPDTSTQDLLNQLWQAFQITQTLSYACIVLGFYGVWGRLYASMPKLSSIGYFLMCGGGMALIIASGAACTLLPLLAKSAPQLLVNGPFSMDLLFYGGSGLLGIGGITTSICIFKTHKFHWEVGLLLIGGVLYVFATNPFLEDSNGWKTLPGYIIIAFAVGLLGTSLLRKPIERI